MADTTGIFWCDHTFNPWWGCNEVSEGCENCYARVWTNFTRGAGYWGPPGKSDRFVTGSKNWNDPVKWNRKAANNDRKWNKSWQPSVRGGQRRLVFCSSMADIFEFNPSMDLVRERLWTLIEQTLYIDWLLLTKRPMNIKRMLPAEWLVRPRPNVWLGTSVELQKWAELRIEALLEVPAVVHFISAEPLLGPLNLTRWMPRINWVITGGESGPKRRAFDIDWVRDIDRQCQGFGVAHFFKQVGGLHPEDGGCLLDGYEVKQFPMPRLELAA
jgi:protein gp37